MPKRIRKIEVGLGVYDVSYSYCSCGYDNKEKVEILVEVYDTIQNDIDKLDISSNDSISMMKELTAHQVDILKQIEKIGVVEKRKKAP